MQLMMKGLPFIYQGQEIGMENTDFTSMEEIDDISTIGEYQAALEAGLSPEEAFNAVKKFSRDNVRTPMQWDNSKNAGFTSGTPWLKVNPQYTKINVESQINDKNSVLSYYKNQTLLVLGNFDASEKAVKLEKNCKAMLLSNMEDVEFAGENEIKLKPYQTVSLEVK